MCIVRALDADTAVLRNSNVDREKKLQAFENLSEQESFTAKV